jgi:hypothetical protein
METLVEKVRQLPEEQQDEVARAALSKVQSLTMSHQGLHELSLDERLKRLHELNAWIDRNRSGNPDVDDSRDGIYDGMIDFPR